MKKSKPTSSEDKVQPQAEIIKLGLDIHAKSYVVVRQVDNQHPQPPQSFTPEKFIAWAVKQKQLGKKVYCCYEAGCFGYVLHRKLESIGIINFVVRPRNWDEYGSKVKTDNRDAKALCDNLDRYLNGNTQALCPVRIPSEEEERRRSLERQRGSLQKESVRLKNKSQGAVRYYGHTKLEANWWKQKNFDVLKHSLPEYLINILATWQRLLVTVNEELKRLTEYLESQSARMLPRGLGALTASILDMEICDWNRFKKPRQVSSYTGLCPSEGSSGGKRRMGSISKHGNPRIRHALLEATWRLFYFQPNYTVMLKWKERMVQGPLTKARKKKIAVAIARQFMVDWWKIQTGRMTPEEVGLEMSWPAAHCLKGKQAE